MRLQTEAPLSEHERLLECQAMLVDEKAEHLEHADRMMHVKHVQRNFLGQLLPTGSISLNESSQNIFERGSHVEVLLLDDELLDALRLARVSRIRHTRNLLALLSRVDDVLMLVVL